jgi:lipoyl synthase
MPQAVVSDEAERVATAVSSLGLSHAVITSVTRDDLPDGGASVFAETVRAIRRVVPGTTVELLIPDFRGCTEALAMIIGAQPEVINHNMETVRRLYPTLRPGASYTRSLDIIRRVTQSDVEILAKSGIMVGVGEKLDEIEELIYDLVVAGCRVLTIGQYLRPTRRHYPVDRFVTPDEFGLLGEMARSLGIPNVVAGPLVRSSYNAAHVLALSRLESS